MLLFWDCSVFPLKRQTLFLKERKGELKKRRTEMKLKTHSLQGRKQEKWEVAENVRDSYAPNFVNISCKHMCDVKNVA